MDIDEIIKSGEEFLNELERDVNGRYKSWEYCYKIFDEAHKLEKIDEQFLDSLCLNLAFYLASWGMYRGSSFLLDKDYKVHKPVVLEILKIKYNDLWGIKVENYTEKNLQILMELKNNIKNIYNGIRLKTEKGEKTKGKVTDTLITKVLMGTIGCVPAYDRNFIKTLKKYKISPYTFSKKSIENLVVIYKKYYNEFEKLRKRTKVENMKYPQMKLLDMCFWRKGKELK